MRPIGAALALVLAVFPRLAAAEARGREASDSSRHEKEETLPADEIGRVPEEPRRFTALVRARYGEATAPLSSVAWPTATGAAATTIAQASWAVRPGIALGLRIPVVLATIERPAGSRVHEAAWGNVELSVAHRRSLGPDLHATLRFAAGAPAEGSAAPSASLHPSSALAVGRAIEGLRTPGLFAPGRAPLTPGAGIDLHRGLLDLALDVDVPVLVRTSGADPEPGVTVRGVGVVPVATAHAAVRPIPEVALGARAWVAAELVAPPATPMP